MIKSQSELQSSYSNQSDKNSDHSDVRSIFSPYLCLSLCCQQKYSYSLTGTLTYKMYLFYIGLDWK